VEYSLAVAAADPLDELGLRQELVRPGSLWRRLDVVAETRSTNADVADLARAGGDAGSVLIANYQAAGRGRQGRIWTAPPGSGIAMSVLLRPEGVPANRWTWLPLIAGLAVAEGVRRASGVPAVLKWPNDVLVGERKICGILAERVETPTGAACVVGMGINVGLEADDLPVPTATSLAVLAAADPTVVMPPRNQLIATVLAAFELLYLRWEEPEAQPSLAAAYLERSATIGRRVRVLLAGDREVEGLAESIDPDGRLVLRTANGREVLSTGDVVNLR
jgi:BirA family transcriptional regulator, biotin operon repressor / biotin---[acetyl-CoA-carboxylase] ligase